MEETVEFVSYNGGYPNLCAGTLIIKINGTQYEFPQFALTSGGSCYFTNGYEDSVIEDGPWSIEFPKDIPKKYHARIRELVNFYVTHGCCGGCL